MRAIKVRAGSRRYSTSRTLISYRFDGLYSVVIVFSFRIVLLRRHYGYPPRISPEGAAVKPTQRGAATPQRKLGVSPAKHALSDVEGTQRPQRKDQCHFERREKSYLDP